MDYRRVVLVRACIVVTICLGACPAHSSALAGERGSVEITPNRFQPTVTTSASSERWGRMVYSALSYTGDRDIFYVSAVSNGTVSGDITNTSSYTDTLPQLSFDAQQIVFVSERSGNQDIYRLDINANGYGVGPEQRLTTSAAVDTEPAWSADGQRVVFVSERDGQANLYAMQANGTNVTRLTTTTAQDRMPAWSPNGGSILWVRSQNDVSAVWSMNADGTNQRQLFGPLARLRHPEWSRDGTRIAFDYDQNGDGRNEVAISTTDGNNIQIVPMTVSSSNGALPADFALGSWSPDDEHLVISWTPVGLIEGTNRPWSSSVGTVSLDGSDVYSSSSGGQNSDAMHPDLRSLDRQPPITKLTSLPAYQRGTSVDLVWSGSDIGVAGNVTYDIQYRIGDAGPWEDWKVRTVGDSYPAPFTGEPGNIYTFRIRGRDGANNIEAWHAPDGNGTVTFYRWKIAGTLTDNRGNPIANAPVSFAPGAIGRTTTDANGTFSTRLSADSAHVVQPNVRGYKLPPPTTLPAGRDNAFNTYLQPADDIIQNGDFELPQLVGWTTDGTLPIQLAQNRGRTGQRSLALGQACALPCLSDPELVVGTDRAGPHEPIAIAVDSKGQIHILASHYDTSTPSPMVRLYYQMRATSGQWSEPVLIGEASSADLVVDTNDGIHVAWVTNANRLLYRHKPASGAWSSQEDLTLARTVELTADTQGGVYVASTCDSIVGCESAGAYRLRLATGTWQPAQRFPARPILAVGPIGVTKVVWRFENQGYLATIQSDGTPGAAQQFDARFDVNSPYNGQAIIDSRGILHLIAMSVWETYYNYQLPNGEMSAPVVIPSGGSTFSLAVSQDTIFILSSTTEGGYPSGLFFRSKTPDGLWTDQVLRYPTPYTDGGITSDTQGAVHMLRQGRGLSANIPDPLYYEVTKPSGAATATLSQRVTIPSDMFNPTLAFDYLLNGVTPSNGSTLEVIIRQGDTLQRVFTNTSGGDWQHAAIDLTPWMGNTVDIVTRLWQADGSSSASALLDDVSLGSWGGPVIHEVSSTVVTFGAPTQLTITGAFFTPGMIVRLGDVLLNEVQFVDANTLRASVPATMRAGRYRLTVVRSDGAHAPGPVLRIGFELVLPITTR